MKRNNVRKIALSAFLISLLAFSASYGRMLEGDGTAPEKTLTVTSTSTSSLSSSGSRWETLKARVVSWWDRMGNESTRQPASEAKPVGAATTPVAAQTTTTVNPAEVQQRAAQLPTYNTAPQREAAAQAVQKDLAAVKAQKVIGESKPARAADPQLPKNKAGVAVLPLKKTVERTTKSGKRITESISVTEIPLLDIGDEAVLSRYDWQIQPIEMRISEFQAPKALATPAVMTEGELKTAMGVPVEIAANAKDLKVSAFGPDEKVTFETVRKIILNPQQETPVNLAEVKLLNQEELKLLKAQILLESGKKCHLATGLLSEIVNSEKPDVRQDANFHLALCLHKMGFFTESIRKMKDVLRSGSAQQVTEALRVLTNDLPREFDEEIASELKKIDENTVPEDARDAYNYIIAKAASRQEHFSNAQSTAAKISKKFKKWPEAQFIMAVADYSLEHYKAALERLESLKKYLDENGGDKNLRALVSINMGRMAFQNKQYKEAIENFVEIKKDHALWVDALIEQGWAQLQAGDFAGAIGNMYSIHSPYFKSVYQPESFVVRSIGYLNICQYGDAYRTLSQLENMHRAWLNQVQSFRKTANGAQHYQAMVKYLKNSNTQQNVDGLPYQVLREIGRHRDYLNLQEAINNRIDEAEQYGFINGMIGKDKAQVKWLVKKSQERIVELSGKIKKAEVNPALAKDLNELKRQKRFEETTIDNLNFVHSVYEESQVAFGKLHVAAMARIHSRKGELQAAAGEVLKGRLKKVESSLVSILDNNELLRYEVFAGSGENIRFHAAGGSDAQAAAGKAGNRVAASVKPENKNLQWQFDGEFWEDEIGNYRSSLKDNCPKKGQQAASR